MKQSPHEIQVVFDSGVLGDESIEILKAKESGVAYILGHSHGRVKQSSSF